MIEYNTQLQKLILPEYGRNVQNMVDYCLTIPDRDERNHCAYSIVNIMFNLFPPQPEESDYVHKLWDHLMIMSDFKLDVDAPFELPTEAALDSKPEPIPYHLEPIRFRHYGKIIEKMILRAAEYPEGDEKDALIALIANHMKKQMFAISKEGVDDEKILNDLYHFSRGRIDLHPDSYKLRSFVEAPQQQQQQQGKKKKKK